MRPRSKKASPAAGLALLFVLVKLAEDRGFEPLRACTQHAFQVCGCVFAEARDRTYLGNLNPAGPPQTVLNAGE